MSTSKIIAVLAATAMVGLFSASAFAESIPQEEIQQYSGSDKPRNQGVADRAARQESRTAAWLLPPRPSESKS